MAAIVDDRTGAPLAARVSLQDRSGRNVEIDGAHSQVESLGKRWCYVDGSFSVGVPTGGLTLEIRRGLETIPVTATIPASATAETNRTFRLQRWIDLRASGCVSGDIHAHTPLPAEAHLQLRAEDLNVVSLLAFEGNEQVPYFTGALDSHSTPGHEIRVDQEVRDWQLGHVTLLNLPELNPGYPQAGGVFSDWCHNPHWLISRAMEWTHARGGLVAWSHFSNLPGAESAIDIALGLVDVLELMTFNDPTQLPSHWGPWDNSGMSQAEFTVMRGMDLYYQYLNAGFRLPIASGTDKMGPDIPLGSNRTYVLGAAQPGYAGWLQGVKAGRSFITNGPILEFDVAGHRPGDVIDFATPPTVAARVTARSILPFGNLEIIQNGRVAARQAVDWKQTPPHDGVYSLHTEAVLKLDRSCWVAARVADDPDKRRPILPRGLSVFAHSNPVFFQHRGKRVREEAAIAYLEKYVQGTIHWLKTKPPFAGQADRSVALKRAHRALAIYRSLRSDPARRHGPSSIPR